jgi:hypothetical protein
MNSDRRDACPTMDLDALYLLLAASFRLNTLLISLRRVVEG